jgi:hypothetical protein
VPSAPLKRDRVFCLEESVWEDAIGLSDQTSVLPTLELLERMGVLSEFVHRHAVGNTEFENYLSWRDSDRRVRTYGTVYLAFHGTRKGLDVGDHPVSLDDLAESIGKLPGGVVHLGSCSVLKRNAESARRFLEVTGARLLSGYERDVEWLDSAAIDTAWLGYVATHARIGDALRFFRSRYGSAVDHLQWQAVTRP